MEIYGEPDNLLIVKDMDDFDEMIICSVSLPRLDTVTPADPENKITFSENHGMEFSITKDSTGISVEKV